MSATNPKDVPLQVDILCDKLRRRQVFGSYNVAMETIKLIRTVVSNSKWSSATKIINTIKDTSKKLSAAQPIELAIKNITGRVLHLIRQEYELKYPNEHEYQGDPVLYRYLGGDKQSKLDQNCYNLKSNIIEGIKEIIDELESSSHNISSQALEHIHSNEIILTIGKSETVFTFLKEAARSRKFQVIVCETAPFFNGHEMAKLLAIEGIETTLITDSAIFAIMSRVNKVILGAHAVTGNGGLVAITGSQPVALAAKFTGTPVVVCAGLYKLSLKYPYDTDEFYMPMNPDSAINFENGDLIEKVDVVNPYFDFVSPDLVSLFITNV
ncbi:Translation initiation factor eIF-2B subunit beta [Clydaea vesicula]|uniref:Translation initiation factor eIF2B subunit beta n=1 Tax=Clydaea vesicula TaxID=447962 RepID=A0AAD5U2C1_9FUNG|nr:Translation initiation factor eIF-2B subunit beta [Clydaea vesicula]KAJ3384307.1 Translation initiation factor eIF-2B subunit beta [Lobulomyces angularis]